MNDAFGRPGLARTALRLLPLVLLLLVAAVVVGGGWHRYLTFQHIAENRSALQHFVTDHFALALIGYMALYIAVVALSLPGGALLTITGGFLFGWVTAGAATVLAATAGATIIFLIARSSLGDLLAARAGPWLDRLAGGFRDNAFSYLLFLRLVPLFPFWLVNIAPALFGMPLATYAIGTAAGIIPGTLAFAFLGAGLDGIVEARQQAYRTCLERHAPAEGGSACSFSLDPLSLLTPELIAGFVVLGLLALTPVLVRLNRRSAARRRGGD